MQTLPNVQDPPLHCLRKELLLQVKLGRDSSGSYDLRKGASEMTGRIIGYARVSTADQNLGLQIEALSGAGADPIHEDRLSGARSERPGLAAALAALRPGDTLAVWRLDRLGRSLRQLIDTAETVRARGAHLRSLTESIDTGSAGGRVLFHVVGALAEFEREAIRERVTAGMATAKRQGKHVGRPAKFGQVQADAARTLLANGASWAEAARALSISESTLSRGLRRHS